MIQRTFKLPKTQSFFLFGARGTGKTTLLHQTFSKKKSVFVDLLDVRVFEEFLEDPGRFEDLIKANKKKRIIVDEIQKLPRLLDTVHRYIQKEKRQFVLTGSRYKGLCLKL